MTFPCRPHFAPSFFVFQLWPPEMSTNQGNFIPGKKRGLSPFLAQEGCCRPLVRAGIELRKEPRRQALEVPLDPARRHRGEHDVAGTGGKVFVMTGFVQGPLARNKISPRAGAWIETNRQGLLVGSYGRRSRGSEEWNGAVVKKNFTTRARRRPSRGAWVEEKDGSPRSRG